jgi:predicted secreted protein
MKNASHALLLSFAALCCAPLQAQDKPVSRDVLTLDATVQTDVVPDLAVITLAVERQGSDTAAMNQEVNQVLAAALKEAKATTGVQAATGGFSTTPRFDNKGQRNGWVIRAELVLRGKDFGVLGKLAGRLAQSMQIASNGFELSPELKSAQETQLIERGLAAFQAKAALAAKALGFASYGLREVTLGSIGGDGGPRPVFRAAKAMAEAVPIEAGPSTLSLTVNGSVQLIK